MSARRSDVLNVPRENTDKERESKEPSPTPACSDERDSIYEDLTIPIEKRKKLREEREALAE
jgi:hypothetical protein